VLEARDSVDENRPLALQVVGQQDVRGSGGELYLRHAGAHALDAEPESTTKHLGEVPHVGGDVSTGRIQVIELNERERLSRHALLRAAGDPEEAAQVVAVFHVQVRETEQ